MEKGERLTGNTLYLPLTYLSLLNEAEIAAVVGHELGHFTGEDTQYSLRFAPSTRACKIACNRWPKTCRMPG
ncbi:M48 family metalloprotease [Pseudocitrobacter faecalis]